jgi:hypothetical protein
MRLKSAIWVSAFLRRCQSQGIYGAVLHKGAEEAGAIYVIVDHRDGTQHLFCPAPGPAYDEEGERRWSEEIAYPARADEVARLLAKRRRVDPDIWIVEVEDPRGTANLKVSD